MPNRYKRKATYDHVVLTPNDESTTTIIHEGGKFKSIEDSAMDLDSCWVDPISRDIMINLYHGTDNFINLMFIF